MSKHHVLAVFEQFPWLERYFGKLKGELGTAQVSRADVGTLSRRAGFEVNVLSMYSRSPIFLFDRTGTLILYLHDGMRWYHRLLCFLSLLNDFTVSYESVGEALAKLEKDGKDCTYVVRVYIDKRHFSYLKIYREPKDRTFIDLLKEKEGNEENGLQGAREEIKKKMTS